MTTEATPGAHGSNDQLGLPAVARLYYTGVGRRYKRASTQAGPGEPLCFVSLAEAALTRQAAQHAAVRDIGAQLANVAFNLAQKPGHVLTSDDVALLDKLRRQWDAVSSRPNYAFVASKKPFP